MNEVLRSITSARVGMSTLRHSERVEREMNPRDEAAGKERPPLDKLVIHYIVA